MNILHMKYALEVARTGSLSRASEKLLIAQPNLSRAIRELEADLGIPIFDRTAHGMKLTPEGEEFMVHADRILGEIADVEALYKDKSQARLTQRLSISVPRAAYISDAFTRFSNSLGPESAEILYRETNAERAIRNILTAGYRLGIIRFAESYQQYFCDMLEEKDLESRVISRFRMVLLMQEGSGLAALPEIRRTDLASMMEIANGDPFVPNLPFSRVQQEEMQGSTSRRIYVFERASLYELLASHPDAFAWVSPSPQDIPSKYGLVERDCPENTRYYQDVLIWRKGYKFTELEKRFLEELSCSRDRCLRTGAGSFHETHGG